MMRYNRIIIASLALLWIGCDNNVIGPQLGPSIVSFTASATSIKVGSSTVLSWNVNDSRAGVQITDGVFVDDVPVIGNKTVTPLVTTDYFLVATGANGNKSKQTLHILVVP